MWCKSGNLEICIFIQKLYDNSCLEFILDCSDLYLELRLVTISKAFTTYMQKHCTKALFIVFTILCKLCIKLLSYILDLKSILSHIYILSNNAD